MFNVHAVYRNADETEGRGPMILKGIFVYEIDARNYARGIGLDPMTRIDRLQVFESLADSAKYRDNELRNSALAKLTSAERKALGLDGQP